MGGCLGISLGASDRPVHIDHLAGVSGLCIKSSIARHIGRTPGLESPGKKGTGIWNYDGLHMLSAVACIATENSYAR